MLIAEEAEDRPYMTHTMLTMPTAPLVKLCMYFPISKRCQIIITI